MVKVYLVRMCSVCRASWACEVPFGQENTASWKDVLDFCCSMFCTTLIWQILSIAYTIRSLQNGRESELFHNSWIGFIFCFCTASNQRIKSVIPHALYHLYLTWGIQYDSIWSNPPQSHHQHVSTTPRSSWQSPPAYLYPQVLGIKCDWCGTSAHVGKIILQNLALILITQRTVMRMLVLYQNMKCL